VGQRENGKVESRKQEAGGQILARWECALFERLVVLRVNTGWYALCAEAYPSFNSTLFAYLGNYVLLSGAMQP
jgi:hypothetical protein